MCHFEEPEPSQRYTILPLTEDTGYFMQWRVSLAALGLMISSETLFGTSS